MQKEALIIFEAPSYVHLPTFSGMIKILNQIGTDIFQDRKFSFLVSPFEHFTQTSR
jgi:hypothetical protein